MIGLMIRIRRDGLSSRRAGIVPKHGENRRPRVFRRLYGNTDIPDHARLRQHKTGLDGPDLVEDIMGKQRREQPQDSIFANNPFLDGLFEWMDSPEGQQSIEVRDVLWNLVEDVQLDAKQRKLIWPDAMPLRENCKARNLWFRPKRDTGKFRPRPKRAAPDRQL